MRTAILCLLLTTASYAGNPFQSVRGELPHQTAQGAYTGSLAWGTARADARLQQFGGTWALAVRPPAQRLIDFAQGLDRSPLAGLDISRPVLVFSPAPLSINLDPESAAYFGVQRLNLERGINLIAKVKPRTGSLAAKLLSAQGIRIDGLVIEGVILRDFDLGALKEARSAGKLKDALRKGTKLTVRLPKLRMTKLPKNWWAHNAYFYVTGEPGIGVGFTLCNMQRTFEADLGLRRAANGSTEAVLTARHKGRWNHAFGINGFHIQDGTFLLSMDAAQNVSIGLKTSMILGRKRVGVAGKLTLHAMTGLATNLIVEGRVDSLGSADLTAIANGLVQARKQHSAAALPEFSLRNVYFRFAPLGGDERLGIAAGIALKGTLFALNRNLAAVDGSIDQTTKPATIKLDGRMANFEAAPVALRDAAVAINMGAVGNPYFRVKGASRMWITRKAIDIDLSRDRMYWAVSDRVAGVYGASYRFQSRNQRSWSGDVRFSNELSKTLERDVSRSATAWANQVKRDFSKAQGDINREIAKVRQLDKQIAAARAQVYRERDKATRDLRAAESKVKQLDGAIAARKKVLYDHQMKLYNQLNWHIKNVKNKHTAWRKAIAATKRAKVWAKPKYKAREAKAWAAYHAAGTARDAKRVEYDLARKKVDVQLNSLQAAGGTAVGALKAAQFTYRKVTGGVSVDADPRVATLFVRRDTAVAALTVARETVKATGGAIAGAGRITAWAAKNHGQLLMVDDARMAASLGTSLRGTGGRMTIKVRFLGKRHTIALNTNLDQVRRGLHAIIWAELKRRL